MLLSHAFCVVLVAAPGHFGDRILQVGPAGYSTIQEAVDRARPDSRIVIAPGIYPESVDLSRMGSAIGGGPGRLTLLGRSNPTIDAAVGRAMYNSAPFAGDLLIDGIGFTSRTNSGLDLRQYHGRLTVLNCRFHGNFENGLQLSDTVGNVRVFWSDFFQCLQKGIVLDRVQDVLLLGIDIDGDLLSTEDGIRGENVQGFSMLHSKLRRTGDAPKDDGIDLKDPTGKVVIHHNLLEDIADDAVMIEANGTTKVNVSVTDNLVLGDPQAIVSRGGIEVRCNEEGSIEGAVSDNELVGLNGHAIELTLKDASKQSVAVEGNVIGPNALSSAITLEAIGNSAGQWDVRNNRLRGIASNGIRASAEGLAKIDVEITGNDLREIGDNAIQVQNADLADLHALIERNQIQQVSQCGLFVRGRHDSASNLMVLNNSFRNTNLYSGTASVLIDDEDGGDVTAILLGLYRNSVSETNGADAYQLNQRDPGQFRLHGRTGQTAQEVVERNNWGRPVSILGTIQVVR